MTDISFFESLQQHQGSNLVFNMDSTALSNETGCAIFNAGRRTSKISNAVIPGPGGDSNENEKTDKKKSLKKKLFALGLAGTILVSAGLGSIGKTLLTQKAAIEKITGLTVASNGLIQDNKNKISEYDAYVAQNPISTPGEPPTVSEFLGDMAEEGLAATKAGTKKALAATKAGTKKALGATKAGTKKAWGATRDFAGDAKETAEDWLAKAKGFVDDE